MHAVELADGDPARTAARVWEQRDLHRAAEGTYAASPRRAWRIACSRAASRSGRSPASLPGQTDGDDAARQMVGITLSIGLERRPIGVELIAVELDDDALGGEIRVDFVTEGGDVGLRDWELVVAAEGLEVVLERRPGRGAMLIGQRPEQLRPAVAAIALGDIGELRAGDEPAAEGRVHCSAQQLGREERGAVEQRAGRAGDADAMQVRDIAAQERTRVMDLDRRTAAAACGDEDDRGRRPAGPGKVAQRQRGETAECAALSARQDRSVGAFDRCRKRPADGVHARVLAVQTARQQRNVDLASRDPGAQEPLALDGTVACHPCDVDFPRMPWFLCHGPSVPRFRAAKRERDAIGTNRRPASTACPRGARRWRSSGRRGRAGTPVRRPCRAPPVRGMRPARCRRRGRPRS